MNVSYIHLPAGSALPPPPGHPFKAVVIEQTVADEWRNQVSDWLVRGGCLYMMAWGRDCSKWDDSVDWANLDRFDFNDIPDDDSVMTTWHEDEHLKDAFRFAEFDAMHPTIDLQSLLILDISPVPRENALMALREAALKD